MTDEHDNIIKPLEAALDAALTEKKKLDDKIEILEVKVDEITKKLDE